MLLDTTYTPPSIGPTVVGRERLMSVLELAVQQRFTTVVAPPGYGKTVALAQWAATHPRRRVRWLRVRPELDDPVAFARALADALGEPSVADLGRMRPTTLVVDEFHLLTHPALLEDLAAFVESAPTQLHLVIATRHDLPLVLYRLRHTSSAIEIRQHDLAFDTSDAAELLERLTGAPLDDALVDALVTRTEGWVAGLQLAALSLRGRTDVEEFVATFAGDDRHVADYLTEQVLDQLPDTTRAFLLSTSVLERLSGPLCDVVTGGRGSQAVLEDLHRRSMFTATLDDGYQWFRYHQLFRALLRQHLHDEDPVREHRLLLRSAIWHFERNDPITAVRDLIEAGAWSEVLDAASVHGGDMLARGLSGTVAGWMRAVPAEVRLVDRRAPLLEAACLAFGGDPEDAVTTLDDREVTGPRPAGERAVASLLRAYAALRRGDTVRAVAEAGQTLADVTTVEDDLPDVLGLTTSTVAVHSAAQVIAGVAHGYRGEEAEATEALDAALGGVQTTLVGGHAIWHVLAVGAAALADAWAGRLSAAEQLGQQALDLADEVGIRQESVLTDPLLALAHVARSRGDLGAARAHLDELARQPRPDRRRLVVTLAAIEQALVELADGDAPEALRSLASTPDHPLVPPSILARRRAIEAQVLMQLGELPGAAAALVLAPCGSVDVALAHAHLAVAQGDLHAARACLTELATTPGTRADGERLLWLSIVDHLEGHTEEAMAGMAAVVEPAGSERDVSLFRGNSLAMGQVRMLYRSDPTPFLRSLVEAPAVAVRSRPSMALAEQLTDRELMVMTLLPTRMSNIEMAQTLGVSLNTVKTHLKHIYRKLGVAERSQAVLVAEELRLL